MKKRIFGVLRCIIFMSILISSLYLINKFLVPKYTSADTSWPTTSSYEQFYKMEKNSIDVLFLGSSVAVNAFSPQEIYNTYGIRSYNLGSEQQSIILSYFWLKEALRFQSPKVVVLDTKFLFDWGRNLPLNVREGLVRKCMDPMQWSEVKKEAVEEICELDPKQSESGYYLTNIRFHTRWEELEEQDFVPDEYDRSELKGYSPIGGSGVKGYKTFKPGTDTESKEPFHENMGQYLDRMTALCKENGISLILVSIPGNTMNDSINNVLTDYAKQKEIDYYNLCEEENFKKLGAKLPKESPVGHANLWGAIKLSDFIGGELKEKYNVPAVQDEQYERTKDYYEHVKKNCELQLIEDINEYLKAIKDDHYTILISKSKNSTKGLNKEIIGNLKALGLKKNLRKMEDFSYLAVIEPGKGVVEKYERENAVAYSGTIRDRSTLIEMTSNIYQVGTSSSIIIDGEDYCDGSAGITVVVYDNDMRKVIDSVTFRTGGSSKAFR